jgi:hypothetical protein
LNKLIVAFAMWFFIGSLLSGIMEGGGGVNATILTVDHTDAVTTLTVASTDGFLKKGYVVIQDEKIQYTNKTATTFTGCTRGWDNTAADSHDARTKVYSPEASVINYALGFDVLATGTTAGAMYIPTILYNFFFVTLPRMILWDYSWLKASEWLQILRYVFMVISIGFLVYMAYMIASALGGILQGIFART